MGSRVWENKILDTLDRRPNKKSDYVLLRSEQVLTQLVLHRLLLTLLINPACRDGSPGAREVGADTCHQKC